MDIHNTKYNGWTNYATWRVRLEMFDGLSVEDILGESPTGNDRDDDVHAVQALLKERAEYEILETSTDSVARGYALAFISDVNWYEIAYAMLSDWAEEHPEAYAEDVA